MGISQSLFLILLLFAAAKLGDSCSCAKPPSVFQAGRAVVNGADAFALANACYEELGPCSQELGWTGSAVTARVTRIGRRGTDHDTKTWWPVTAQLDVSCSCRGRSASITVTQKVYLSGSDKSGWRTTNAL